MSFNRVRIGLGLLCLVAVFFLPWWVALTCAFVLCLRYRAWEIVPMAIAFDLIWVPAFSLSWNGMPLATLTAFAVLMLLEPIRRELLTGSRLP